ncbi:MAG: acetate/propionate family kinase [Thermoleophilia bacterium]|nr:acetate/propionate family kinase [Thermoleophilia bacterium]
MSATQTILSINSGSSSLKFRLYEMGGVEQLLAKGVVEGIGQGEGRLRFVDAGGEAFAERDFDSIGPEQAIEQALAALSDKALPSIEAVGHRVVHGGPGHLAPELLTPELIEDLRVHTPWAPLHMPASLRVIDSLRVRRPGLPQVACFDTAFHARMPEVARRLPLPRRFFDQGVQKYGFHGLSYEYILSVLGERAGCRLVMAHLGNGASMAACVGGRPLDTTMGMTPLGGFMMGTRTGDMDPGALVYLMRERGYGVDDLEGLLDKESGLKGVSGETADMETLLELRAGGHQDAAQAVEMYCYQARKTIGSLAAVMGGVDLLVFAGGIGENAAIIRALICRGLEHLGIELDPAKNCTDADIISSEGATCAVSIVRTNEDLMIARHSYRLVFGDAHPA